VAEEEEDEVEAHAMESVGVEVAAQWEELDVEELEAARSQGASGSTTSSRPSTGPDRSDAAVEVEEVVVAGLSALVVGALGVAEAASSS